MKKHKAHKQSVNDKAVELRELMRKSRKTSVESSPDGDTSGAEHFQTVPTVIRPVRISKSPPRQPIADVPEQKSKTGGSPEHKRNDANIPDASRKIDGTLSDGYKDIDRKAQVLRAFLQPKSKLKVRDVSPANHAKVEPNIFPITEEGIAMDNVEAPVLHSNPTSDTLQHDLMQQNQKLIEENENLVRENNHLKQILAEKENAIKNEEKMVTQAIQDIKNEMEKRYRGNASLETRLTELHDSVMRIIPEIELLVNRAELDSTRFDNPKVPHELREEFQTFHDKIDKLSEKSESIQATVLQLNQDIGLKAGTIGDQSLNENIEKLVSEALNKVMRENRFLSEIEFVSKLMDENTDLRQKLQVGTFERSSNTTMAAINRSREYEAELNSCAMILRLIRSTVLQW